MASESSHVHVERGRRRVVAANTAPCGQCWACTRCRLSLCENLIFFNGAFAEQVVIGREIVERDTYEIPETLDFSAAAPLEPLSIVVHGMAESGIELGDTAAVESMIKKATPGGRGADVGAPFSVDSSAMHYQEYTLKGVFHHTPRYVKTAVDLMAAGQVDTSLLITEQRPLDRLVDSLKDMAAGRGSKYVLVP